MSIEAENVKRFVDTGKIEKGMSEASDVLLSLMNREGAGSNMLGWLNLPDTPEDELDTIINAAKKIKDENDCLVVIGIGGSYLGARAAIEALPEEGSFPIVFAGNSLSPGYHDRLLSSLDGKRFAVCVISKSGTTTEPAIAFRLLRKRLIEQLGKEEASKKIIAITDAENGALKKMADSEGILSFAIPRDVGGRFSILSPVGLLPCAVAGIPIKEMIDGASSAIKQYTRGGEDNIMLRYALLRYILHNQGTAVEVLSTFHPELDLFCGWWKQLAGESEGKDGKGLFPASTVMTTDLHSLGQFLQDGSRNLLETFLVAERPRRDLTVPEDKENLDNLNYLAGRSLGEINRKAYEGTKAAHISGGIPVISLQTPSITPASIGELFIFFELSVAVTGRLLGVNPFNQPGVEEYKTRMFKLLGKPGI
ncbi:glucose-6-phosphate isomerase [bacterium]|nr:glucose-6-phosphate isomerase [bacterium]